MRSEEPEAEKAKRKCIMSMGRGIIDLIDSQASEQQSDEDKDVHERGALQRYFQELLASTARNQVSHISQFCDSMRVL